MPVIRVIKRDKFTQFIYIKTFVNFIKKMLITIGV
ncbi:hypothetical protein M2448_002907 [Dysgonomonas sp. PF1-14]|nr:hypothetical protein [Dysgonomonas sp. PF1-14]MDH6398843.1 hypothetical protein [Dysgonomonas sp. PF1-23]